MTIDVEENVVLNKLKFDYYTLEVKEDEIYVLDEKDISILGNLYDEKFSDWKGKYLIPSEGGYTVIDNLDSEAFTEHVNNLSVAIAWLIGESEDIAGEVYIEDGRKTDVLRYLELIKSINKKIKDDEDINFDSIVDKFPDYSDKLYCFYTALDLLGYQTDEIKEKNEYFNKFLLEHRYIDNDRNLQKVLNSFNYLLYLEVTKLLTQNTINNMIDDIEILNEELRLNGINSEVVYDSLTKTIDSTIEAENSTTLTVDLDIKEMRNLSDIRPYVEKRYKEVISKFDVDEEFNTLWNCGDPGIQSMYSVKEFVTNLENDKYYFEEMLGLI